MSLDTPLTIALSKGRIFDETLPLLAHAGIEPLDDPETSRKLILETNMPHVRFLIIRASDVPTYVQYGAADLGVSGKDVLLEHGGEGLYEPLDLGIARCRLMVAGLPDVAAPATRRLRIATKYVKSAERYYASKGEQVEIIKLYGSMELAPLVHLSDRIVDLVESGNTLKANGLVPLEHIADISSRLVVNKASWKMKHSGVTTLLDALREAVASRSAPAQSAQTQSDRSRGPGS
ncbi:MULTISPECIES: ATP phosphoribosyltransferase [unclassified Thiocapsa]|uniref:ATP phosphoribosyltransferase n=1 Tax=unclassified Thiocapsa TaxID=2641286 RepID=UPI0035B15B4E